MKQLFLLFFTLMTLGALAQKASISGQIIDQEDGTPIEYATITLHNPNDSSLLEGLVTDPDGRFSFDNLKYDEVYLSAQFMGYEPYRSETYQLGGTMQLEPIGLTIVGNNLAEVQVTGRAITSRHKVDKQVYDAAQFQSARGGSATDVLRNLPSVSLNAAGDISVRGASGFQVMINGRPVQSDPATILSQLPANSIEDIEIITAPSAKYDPDGNAGIINIITSKGATDGFFLSSNVLVGLPAIEDYDNADNTQRYGADITANYLRGKWDLSLGLNYRRYDISGRREGYVNTYTDEVLTEFPSDGERSFDEENYAARLSATFRPTDNQAITAGFYAGKRTKDRTADILYQDQQRTLIPQEQFLDTEAYYDLYQDNGTVFSGGTVIDQLTYFNENLRVRKGDFLIGSLDYSLGFADGGSLSLSGLYEHTVLGGPTDNANLDYPNTDNILQLQYNDNDNPLDGYRFQADYSRPIGEGGKLETGYQFRYLKHPGDFEYFDRDLDNQIWVENPLFTNSIELRRAIHSVYGQYSGQQGKWQYSAGLRGEYFDREVDIARPDETYTLDKFNLFPSANLSYAIQPDLRLKAAYSRRIARTTTFKMTPFPEREHSETLEQGDAELLPEYIDVVEAGVVKNWEDNSVFINGYYRHVDNVINRVNTVFNDTILNRIYTNVGEADVLGIEAGFTVYPAQWWRIYMGGNIFDYKLKGEVFGDEINTSNTVYSLNGTMDFYVSATFSMQLGLNYLSERVTAQGRDSRFYNPSFSARKTFMDDRLSLNLQWQNLDLGLLDANEQRITTVRDNFFTTTNYVYEVDIVQLSISYQLSQVNKKAKLPDSEFGKSEF